MAKDLLAIHTLTAITLRIAGARTDMVAFKDHVNDRKSYLATDAGIAARCRRNCLYCDGLY